MRLKQGILLLFTGMVLLMLFIFVTSIPQQKSFLKSEVIGQLTESNTVTSTLLLLMSTEIPQLKPHLEKEDDITTPRLSHLLFKMTSGITPNSYSSLLQAEVPGLDSYARGVNLSNNNDDSANMPIESPPPDFESLLKEGENEDEDDSSESEEKAEDSGEKKVFIYHTHSWEAFLPLMDGQKKPSDASSTDNKKNVAYVGSMLSERLENMGVHVDHDKTNATEGLHEKGWDYNDSYRLSRETVENVMGENDSLKYFVDIHRDSQTKDVTTASFDGEDYAKVFFTVGLAHDKAEENLQFAEDLNDEIEEKYPGVSRGVYKKDKSEGDGVYNQDLSDRSILIEVGGVDNTEEELKNTADALSEILGDYIIDAEKVDG